MSFNDSQAGDSGDAIGSIRSAEPAIAILRVLDQCEPRKIQNTSMEEKAKKIANWLIGLSFVLLAGAALFVFTYDVRPAPEYIKFAVVLVCTVSMLLALASMCVPIVVSLWLIRRWKKISFGNLCGDLTHEYEQAKRLEDFGCVELLDAQFWLDRKIRRITAKTTRFFGEKTAAIGLIATSYSFVGEFGGITWITTTLARGFSVDNIANTVLLLIGAALIGISIGTMLLDHVASRYRYQCEILELAIRYKKNS